MNFKDKMKLFFETFFNDNKAVFITLLMLFLLFIFAKLNTVSAASSDFSEVEYIDLSGRSFVVDYLPTNNTKIVLDYNLDYTNFPKDNNDKSVHNILYAGDSYRLNFHHAASIVFRARLYLNGVQGIYSLQYERDGYYNYFGRHSLSIDKNQLFLDDNLLTSVNCGTFTATQLLEINSLSNDVYLNGLYVYGISIYENDVKVQEYKPIILNNSYEYCFYETFSNRIYKLDWDTSESGSFSFPTILFSLKDTSNNSKVLSTQELVGMDTDIYEVKYCYEDGEWLSMYLHDNNIYSCNITKNGSYKLAYFNKLTSQIIPGAPVSTLTVTTIGEIPDTDLQLNVSTTEPTSQFVKIYTQDFTEDFINSHKCYYSYSYDENNNRIWYPCEISDTYSYYTNAWENGAYVFRLEDLEGNNISTATMNITNIQTTPIIDNDSVICPVLSVKPSGLNSVDVFTQSLTLSNISRLECYYWLSSENGSFTNKNKLLATDTSTNGVRNFFFKYTLSKDDTIYFVFYDTVLDKYSDIVSLTVNINEVLTNPAFGNTDQLSILLHQKFGVFYSFSYFLSDFWDYLNNLNDTKPNFNITLPDFLGGGTYSAFDFTFYDSYRMYVHYIIAGFCYFFFIKFVINKMINLLNIS